MARILGLMSTALGLLLLLSASPTGFGAEPVSIPDHNPDGLTSFEWQAIPSPQYVGEPFRVILLARDENGASYDYDGTAFLSTSLGAYVVPAVVQFFNGVCDTSITVTLADHLSLRCFNDSASGLSNQIEVATGAPRRFVTILPGEQLAPGIAGGRTGSPDSHTAGDVFSFEVYLTDDWYNQVDLDDSVYLSSDDRFGRLPAAGELVNGIGSFTASLRTAGQRHIYVSPAAEDSLLADTSSAIDVTAGAYTQMLVVTPGETVLPGDTTSALGNTPGKAGTPDPQYLRNPFDVTVYACDRCWNPRAGTGNPVYLLSGEGDSCSPAVAELRDTVGFMFRFSQRGDNRPLWVRDSTTKAESYVTYIDVRARGTTIEVDPLTPDTIRAGETAAVKVRVRDANGDPVVAALVQFVRVLGTGNVLEPALLTDTIGYATSHFVCTPSPASEQDSIEISSGDADTIIGIYVRHLSDSLFAFPNPFGRIVNRESTLIFYSLHRASAVRLTIYDPFGNEVWRRRFNQGEPGAMFGDNVVYWDGRNKKGQRVASGVYLIQVLGMLQTGIDFKGLYRVGVVW
ncbi:hypothetical protein JXD38_09645 [candidate division WOR-3 bacterium]|nr:hypothetical protein [candidate division WOR-3 bacterium]